MTNEKSCIRTTKQQKIKRKRLNWSTINYIDWELFVLPTEEGAEGLSGRGIKSYYT